jgi:enoyl-CoA hydratase/carnithine racemase
MTDLVTYELRGPVAWLTIRRPEARNALSAQVRGGLWDGIRTFTTDDAAKVLVLTGEGEVAFSAGADLKEMATTSMEVPPADFLPQMGRNITVEKPTIAAVNGVAFAGGFALAQSCDLCVAADHAQFAISEARVGRGAPWAAPLAAMLPRRIVLELLMTAAPISAARAYDLGLVNAVVPAAELTERTQALAEGIAQNAPLSVRAAKAMVDALDQTRSAGAFDLAEAIWQPVYTSVDAQEGPAAFEELRTPKWQGR